LSYQFLESHTAQGRQLSLTADKLTAGGDVSRECVTFQRRIEYCDKEKVCRGRTFVVYRHQDRVQAKCRSILDTNRYHCVSITIRYSSS